MYVYVQRTDYNHNVILYTVSFHNFKSKNSKLSVSSPKSKYVAYVSVLSQNSNCQGLAATVLNNDDDDGNNNNNNSNMIIIINN